MPQKQMSQNNAEPGTTPANDAPPSLDNDAVPAHDLPAVLPEAAVLTLAPAPSARPGEELLTVAQAAALWRPAPPRRTHWRRLPALVFVGALAWGAVTLGMAAPPGALSSLLHAPAPTYRTTARLQISPPASDKQAGDALPGVFTGDGKNEQIDLGQPLTPGQHARVLASGAVREQAARRLGVAPEAFPLIHAQAAETGANGGLILVYADSDANPRRATDAVNAVLAVHLENVLNAQKRDGKRRLAALDEQIANVRSAVAGDKYRANGTLLAKKTTDAAEGGNASAASTDNALSGVDEDTLVRNLETLSRRRDALTTESRRTEPTGVSLSGEPPLETIIAAQTLRGGLDLAAVNPRTAPIQTTAAPLIVALLCAASTSMFMNFRAKSQDSLTKASRLMGIRNLGEIPTLIADNGPEQGTLIAECAASSPAVGLYKRLAEATSLSGASDRSRPNRTVAVTSTEVGEGISTTVANLAIALGMEGLSVLVVDANLHNPCQHILLGTRGGTSSPGLTDMLVGNVASPSDVARATRVENVRVIPAGSVTVGDPAALFGSRTMERFVKTVAPAMADVVLFDTPSVLSGEPGTLLLSKASGILFVIDLGSTKMLRAQQAVKTLAGSGANILGGLFVRANGSVNVSIAAGAAAAGLGANVAEADLSINHVANGARNFATAGVGASRNGENSDHDSDTPFARNGYHAATPGAEVDDDDELADDARSQNGSSVADPMNASAMEAALRGVDFTDAARQAFEAETVDADTPHADTPHAEAAPTPHHNNGHGAAGTNGTGAFYQTDPVFSAESEETEEEITLLPVPSFTTPAAPTEQDLAPAALSDQPAPAAPVAEVTPVMSNALMPETYAEHAGMNGTASYAAPAPSLPPVLPVAPPSLDAAASQPIPPALGSVAPPAPIAPPSLSDVPPPPPSVASPFIQQIETPAPTQPQPVVAPVFSATMPAPIPPALAEMLGQPAPPPLASVEAPPAFVAPTAPVAETPAPVAPVAPLPPAFPPPAAEQAPVVAETIAAPVVPEYVAPVVPAFAAPVLPEAIAAPSFAPPVAAPLETAPAPVAEPEIPAAAVSEPEALVAQAEPQVAAPQAVVADEPVAVAPETIVATSPAPEPTPVHPVEPVAVAAELAPPSPVLPETAFASVPVPPTPAFVPAPFAAPAVASFNSTPPAAPDLPAAPVAKEEPLSVPSLTLTPALAPPVYNYESSAPTAPAQPVQAAPPAAAPQQPAPVAAAVRIKPEMTFEVLSPNQDTTTLRASAIANPAQPNFPRLVLEISALKSEVLSMRAGAPASGGTEPTFSLETTSRREAPAAATMRVYVADAHGAPSDPGAVIFDASLQSPETVVIRSLSGQPGKPEVTVELKSDKDGGTRFRATMVGANNGGDVVVEMTRTLESADAAPAAFGASPLPRAAQWKNAVSLTV